MSITTIFKVKCDKYRCEETADVVAEVTFDSRKIPVFKLKLPLGWEEQERRHGEDPEYKCPSHASPSF